MIKLDFYRYPKSVLKDEESVYERDEDDEFYSQLRLNINMYKRNDFDGKVRKYVYSNNNEIYTIKYNPKMIEVHTSDKINVDIKFIECILVHLNLVYKCYVGSIYTGERKVVTFWKNEEDYLTRYEWNKTKGEMCTVGFKVF